jgi:hypothetical protein
LSFYSVLGDRGLKGASSANVKAGVGHAGDGRSGRDLSKAVSSATSRPLAVTTTTTTTSGSAIDHRSHRSRGHSRSGANRLPSPQKSHPPTTHTIPSLIDLVLDSGESQRLLSMPSHRAPVAGTSVFTVIIYLILKSENLKTSRS